MGVTNAVTYYYRISAVNAVGEGPMSEEVEAMPSNLPPQCAVTNPPDGATISGTHIVRGTASDPDGTVERVEISIDGGEWRTTSGTEAWSFSLDTTTLGEGAHTIRARSYDGSEYSGVDAVTVTVVHARTVDMGPVLWAVVAIAVALVLILLLLLRRKRRKGNRENE
jgi:hypothetical protein